MEDRFRKKVLLRVRYGFAVWIRAARIGEHARESSGVRIRQRNADARLDDGVAAPANAGDRVDLDAIQWMGNGFHQSARRPWGKLCIRIERENVPDRLRQISRCKNVARAFIAEECV